MRFLLPIFLIIIGAIGGFLVHDAFIHGDTVIDSPVASPASAYFDTTNNLRVDLNSVFRENIILLTSSLRRIHNKEPFAPDALEALQENTQDIGDIVGKYYGANAKTDFLDRWKSQNYAYITFTEAVRDHDATKKAEVEVAFNTYIESSLAFWQKINPNFDTFAYKLMLSDRIFFIKTFVTDLSTAKISDSYKQQHNAYQQNGKIADFLTLSIAKQFPDKFK